MCDQSVYMALCPYQLWTVLLFWPFRSNFENCTLLGYYAGSSGNTPEERCSCLLPSGSLKSHYWDPVLCSSHHKRLLTQRKFIFSLLEGVFCKLEQFSLNTADHGCFTTKKSELSMIAFLPCFWVPVCLLVCRGLPVILCSLAVNVFTVDSDTLQYISVLSSACAEGINTNTHASYIHKYVTKTSHKYTRIHNFCSVP